MTEGTASTGLLVPDWSATVPENPLAQLSLDVWRWRASTSPLRGRALCDADEHNAASLPPSRRDRFLSRRTFMRRILAWYLGCEPEHVVIGRTARGRPFIEHPRTTVDFNLSDSQDTVVLALTKKGRIGVDIEYHRPLTDPLAIARRILPAPWTRELAVADERDRLSLFFSMWTRFEACQKARGHGVFAPRATNPEQCFGEFLAAPGCSAHVCLADVDTTPNRQSWRFLDYSHHD